jgi:hypothetical protein
MLRKALSDLRVELRAAYEEAIASASLTDAQRAALTELAPAVRPPS